MKKQTSHKFLLILFLVSFIAVPASASVLKGNNPAYAGKIIQFYQYTDPVTLQKKPAFSVEVDSKGSFEVEVKLKENSYFFCEFGIYRGMLVVLPGTDMEILFPPVREKSFADQKNPYFEPVLFWFATKSGEQATDQVSAFENDFNKLTDKYFNLLYFRQSSEKFDSIKNRLNEKYAGAPEVLQMHKSLKLAALKTDAFRLGAKNVAGEISTISKQYWVFPAFIEFFQKIFNNNLSFEASDLKGAKIKKAMAQQDVGFLLDFIQENYQLTGAPAQLALVKMLHDAFYSGEFSQNGILKMLGSEKLTSGTGNKIAGIARNVVNKLEFLRPGTMAPVICLKNIDGYRVCTDEYQGKYKYIIFADTEMIVCREHLKYLTTLQDKFQNELQIIIVLRKSDPIEMKMFLDKQQVPGVKLVDQHNEVIEKYKVQSFPVAYLLNKQHEVVLQHTQNPLDGFEQQFATFMRSKRIEELRNQAR